MPCTTLLAGKNITYDGSTMTARNEDSGSTGFCAKKFKVIHPEEQPRLYKTVLSHQEITLPNDPMRYTSMPNAVDDEGIWAAAGVNACNVSMTATETITSNDRVLSADPLTKTVSQVRGTEETPGGIGEEDIVTIVLPYIHSAREGVKRLGSLLKEYGTYEMNGIAFQDVDEVWWLETIGGHHWIARRVPDDCYVAAPNSFGIDTFDLNDAFSEQKEHMCSEDLREFIADNHLDLSLDGVFNARRAFGSHTDSDHVYNTPRAWIIRQYFNPSEGYWGPEDDDIPWCAKPEHKITAEDVKYVLSNHYQGTDFDPYSKHADPQLKGSYRPIGVNRNNFLSLVQIRPYLPEEIRTIEWVAFGSNVFNAFVPLYTQIETSPEYISNTSAHVTTENFYWANRIIAALADSQFALCANLIERYQDRVLNETHRMIKEADRVYMNSTDFVPDAVNEEIISFVKKETDDVLDKVLLAVSLKMKNGFARSDA